MQYWLIKSEPETFGIDHLAKLPKQTDCWEGVRNYQARNMMRDDMRIGDLAFFYHSNCKPPGIVGIAKIVKESYPDHTQFDPDSKYYDPKADSDNPRWFMVDVKLEKKFKHMITLDALKHEPRLKDFALTRKGNRLSVMPVSKHNWDIILSMNSQNS